ncbi:MAG: hypothetical protein C4520_14345 [Candidatus Abyssobacteria bacterium SURF_5]|uniref:Putative zinc-finger domain-containing protein n=1 Tax=Abyssobacteria bacterium (strain SURF_5) TaxID=2093360 RepID=A0A3A4NAT4_ABYX5|nr:MAG: hypothetical protein C4520_14345 [Candidatus Abyssubacteria bacterium SURF_5]
MKMACEKVRGLLERFHDKELDERDSKSVAEHLEGCALCSRDLAKLEHVSGIVKTHYDMISASQNFTGMWARINSSLDAAAPAPAHRRVLTELLRFPKPVWATIGAVAAAVLLLFVYLPGTQEPAIAANDCIIDTVEAEDSSVMVFETDDTKMKIIWVMNQDDQEQGVTS